MKDWNDCIENPIEDGYIVSEKIVMSVSFNFVRFGIQFCKMLGLEISEKTLNYKINIYKFDL